LLPRVRRKDGFANTWLRSPAPPVVFGPIFAGSVCRNLPLSLSGSRLPVPSARSSPCRVHAGKMRNTTSLAGCVERGPDAVLVRTRRASFKLKVCAILSALSISTMIPQISRAVSLSHDLPLGAQKTTLLEHSSPRECTPHPRAWSTYEPVVHAGVGAVAGAVSTYLVVGRRRGPAAQSEGGRGDRLGRSVEPADAKSSYSAPQHVGIFVDVENLGNFLKHSGAEKLVETASEYGSPIVRKAFGNWANPGVSAHQARLVANGFQLVHTPHPVSGKNSADIAMSLSVSGSLAFSLLLSVSYRFSLFPNPLHTCTLSPPLFLTPPPPSSFLYLLALLLSLFLNSFSSSLVLALSRFFIYKRVSV